MSRFVVCGSRPWNQPILEPLTAQTDAEWHFVGHRDELRALDLDGIDPRYIFFVHWSWIVPADIVDRYECVGFHLTDLPYGRGGSPLQNLIERGHRATKLSAFRLTDTLDAGPIYLKEDLSLEGGAEEIYLRVTRLAGSMIARIAREHPEPVPQTGQPVEFARRTPEQSRIPDRSDLVRLFDFIRMLDAEGYPRAFLEWKGFRYAFSRPTLYNGRIVAEATITPIEEDA